jgi:hypothetical protein
MMMSGYYTGHPATADEVGAAECYKAALVFAAAPAHQPVAPPWAQAIHQQLVHLRDDLAGVRADIVGHQQILIFGYSNTYEAHRIL